MLEDLIYELLPVIGFALCILSIFILFIINKISKSNNSIRFCKFFAISDLMTGIGVLFSGFYGVIVTIYGDSVETIIPFDCLYRAFHIILFLLSDYLHLFLISWFTIDRFIQILIPTYYGKIFNSLANWKIFFLFTIFSSLLSIRGTTYAIENRTNDTVQILVQCRFNDVVGEEFYIQHILTIQWVPIFCIGVMLINALIYGVRKLRHKWSYNWIEEDSITKQLFGVLFMRCFLTSISIHVPLLIISRSADGNEILNLKDTIVRISYWIIVIVFQPIWHLLILTPFQSGVSSVFNKYSENTERKWQSADDPPPDNKEHTDRHGSPNPFGSWYSITGNITGEAGIPMGNERSVSFYYDK